MRRAILSIIAVSTMTGPSLAQEFPLGGPAYATSEPLYSYDDQEVWKHGWIQVMPFYGGYHSFRPYNYKQVFAQSAQAAAWGMPHTMPYSQQFYHRYESYPAQNFNAWSAPSSPHEPQPSALHQPLSKALRPSPR